MTDPIPHEPWLVCPTTREQTDHYWQTVTPCRQAGIELLLCPLDASADPPWDRLRCEVRWRGLVLWPDAAGKRLWQQACQYGVQVRCLAPDPRPGLQPWSGV